MDKAGARVITLPPLASTLPTNVAPPSPRVSGSNLSDLSPAGESMSRLAEYVKEMGDIDAVRCPQRIFRWAGEILSDYIDAYVTAHGATAAHLRLLEVLLSFQHEVRK